MFLKVIVSQSDRMGLVRHGGKTYLSEETMDNLFVNVDKVFNICSKRFDGYKNGLLIRLMF